MAVTLEREENKGGATVTAQTEDGEYIFIEKRGKELVYKGPVEAVYDEDLNDEFNYPLEVREALESEGYIIVS